MSSLYESYFEELGIKCANNVNELKDLIAAKSDSGTANHIIDVLFKRGDGNANTIIYDLPNESLKLSLAFFQSYDYGYLKKLMRQLEKRADSFGNNILDIGCGNGFITCFIALLKPESNVLGIDLFPKALDRAQELVSMLNLTNVSFKQQDYITVSQQFDTVFASKITHEVINFDDFKQMESPQYNYDHAFKNSQKFAKQISSIVNDNGTFITADRIPQAISKYGYYYALVNNGIIPDMDTYNYMTFYEMGEKSSMPFVVCRKGDYPTDKLRDYCQKELTE